MKCLILSFVRRALNDQRGQVLPWLAMGMVTFLALSGLTIDVGHAYVIRGHLQNTANAAALAAAGLVYTSDTATVNTTTQADQFSAGNGDENASSSLGTVNTSVTSLCLNMLMPPGSSCTTSSPPNAVRVINTTSVKTFFMALLGYPSLNVGAAATASIQGVANSWNVAIIVDSTESMSTTDSNCSSLTEFQCALNGVATLLQVTNPCPVGVASCNSPSSANFRVSLFTFPNITTATVADDYGCTGVNPTIKPYTLPLTNASSYSPVEYSTGWSGSSPSPGSTNWTATYQVTGTAPDADANGFVSDYYKSSSSNGLNPNSSIVKAIGASSGCAAMQNPGGESTYYGGVLYAAEAALQAEQAANPGSKNAIVLLSDGEANAAPSKFPFGQSPAMTTLAADGLSTATTTGNYPAAPLDECQQAIMAGQAATAAGTRVYTVAYGAESDGCAVSGSGATVTDTSLIATGNNAPFTLSNLLPCVTMENIASSLDYFYSDWQQSGSSIDTSCVDASHKVVAINDIMMAISSTFTTPRLVPNNAN